MLNNALNAPSVEQQTSPIGVPGYMKTQGKIKPVSGCWMVPTNPINATVIAFLLLAEVPTVIKILKDVKVFLLKF